MSGPGFIQGVPDFDKLEIVVAGNTSVSSNGSTISWTTIPHNLGYRPMVLAFMDDVGIGGIFSDGDIPLPTWQQANLSDTFIKFSTWLFASADTTNVYAIMFNTTGSPVESFNIKYYLLRERSN